MTLKLKKERKKDMEVTVYDEEKTMELWRKMKEIMTSGKTTGEILYEIEEICPEFAQEGGAE